MIRYLRTIRSLFPRRRPRDEHRQFEHVLGTALEIRLLVDRPGAADLAEAAVLREIERLESIFSVFRDSELLRWSATRDRPVEVSPELADALVRAEAWRVRTGGAFDPRVEARTRYWQARHDRSTLPARETELPERGPPWTVERGGGRHTAIRHGAAPITLNAFAKGIIVDRACEAAARVPGVRDTLVNIGGEIRHIGTRSHTVGVVDPFAEGDNLPPIAHVRLSGGAVATSGSSYRGFEIDGRHRSHVIDPATGDPADAVRSVTVVADTAADADALATACAVLGPDRGVDLIDSVPRAAASFALADGRVAASVGWRRVAAD